MKPPIADPGPVDFSPEASPAGPRSNRWGCFMIGLWIYSLLIVILGMIGTLIPSTPGPAEQSTQDAVAGIIMFSPVVLFLVLAGIKNFRS